MNTYQVSIQKLPNFSTDYTMNLVDLETEHLKQSRRRRSLGETHIPRYKLKTSVTRIIKLLPPDARQCDKRPALDWHTNLTKREVSFHLNCFQFLFSCILHPLPQDATKSATILSVGFFGWCENRSVGRSVGLSVGRLVGWSVGVGRLSGQAVLCCLYLLILSSVCSCMPLDRLTCPLGREMDRHLGRGTTCRQVVHSCLFVCFSSSRERTGGAHVF